VGAETKQELLDAVGEVQELRQAQQRDGARYSEVLSERDVVIEQLQGAVTRLEAAGLSAVPPDQPLARLRQERDKAQEEVRHQQQLHEHDMEALKAQVDRTNHEHHLLDHDRQRVIQELKAKVVALETCSTDMHNQTANDFQSARHTGKAAEEALHESPAVREVRASRPRVLPPPPSPPVQGTVSMLHAAACCTPHCPQVCVCP